MSCGHAAKCIPTIPGDSRCGKSHRERRMISVINNVDASRRVFSRFPRRFNIFARPPIKRSQAIYVSEWGCVVGGWVYQAANTGKNGNAERKRITTEGLRIPTPREAVGVQMGR